MDRHAKTVAQISSAVRKFFDQKLPYRINHGSTNSTRPGALSRDRVATVNIAALNNVLEIDTAKRTALVEPNVPMDRLVEATLTKGLIPPIVMEFPGITTGGGYAGTAGESSSFKHGFFDDTINEVEMVLANGEVVKASRGERADLFHGAAGAVGTLGVTTLIELQLKEAKRYVKTTYTRTKSVQEAINVVREQTHKLENDYVDGILYSKDHGVVVTGTLTDEKPDSQAVQTFSRASDPWFYLHVADRTRAAAEPVVEYVPLAEYLFRYDRGGFWVGAAAFDYFKVVPFNRATRWFLDDFLHTRMLYRALHGSGESARFIVQDLALPYATASRFVDYTADNLGIWPLWLCPLRRPKTPTFHPHTTTPPAVLSGKNEDQDMLNIGVWGWGPSDPETFAAKNRELENNLRELGGMKWLYAHAYYAENDFWQIYGRDWYDALREKYNAGTLPTVYDKVNVAAKTKSDTCSKKDWRRIWPLAGFTGISKSIKSKDYMLHRNAQWKYRGE